MSNHEVIRVVVTTDANKQLRKLVAAANLRAEGGTKTTARLMGGHLLAEGITAEHQRAAKWDAISAKLKDLFGNPSTDNIIKRCKETALVLPLSPLNVADFVLYRALLGDDPTAVLDSMVMAAPKTT